jgi:hypothetical protein
MAPELKKFCDGGKVGTNSLRRLLHKASYFGAEESVVKHWAGSNVDLAFSNEQSCDLDCSVVGLNRFAVDRRAGVPAMTFLLL